jgi:hypothetical protein
LLWPLEAHDGEVEDGCDGRHVLHVVDELAEEGAESPRKWEELCQLKPDRIQYVVWPCFVQVLEVELRSWKFTYVESSKHYPMSRSDSAVVFDFKKWIR